MLTPAKSRARISEHGNELQIVIPSKKDYFVIGFVFLWMTGWFWGEASAIYVMVANPARTYLPFDGFLLVWLAFWTCAGAFTGSSLVRLVAGREVMTLSPGALLIERRPGVFRSPKRYSLEDSKNLRVDVRGGYSRFEVFGYGGEVLAFDYGTKTVRFAAGIDEAEGKFIVGLLKEKGSRSGSSKRGSQGGGAPLHGGLGGVPQE